MLKDSVHISQRTRFTTFTKTNPTSTLLDAFAKLRKMNIIFVMSVCQSVRMEQLHFHWTGFREIRYLSIFFKSVEKIQLSLK